MALMIGDNLLVYHTYKLGDNSASFSRWYNIISLSGTPTLATIINDIDQWLWAWTEPILGEANYDRVTHVYHWQNGVSVDDMSLATTGFSPGGTPGPPLPPNVAALTSFYATNRKPREVCKLYWPHLRSDFMGNDTRLTATAIADIGTSSFLLTLARNFGPVGQRARVNPVIYHRSTGTTHKLETYKVASTIATQRRRVRGSQKAEWES